jgi:hypothetical protein
MSYTEIFGFSKDGSLYSAAEIRNAWRGAMAVWNKLDTKYLPVYRPDFVPSWVPDDKIEAHLGFKPTRTSAMFDGEAMKSIWDLFKNEAIDRNERIVLGATFDRTIVMREHFDELISAFEAFEGETSLKEQAAVIREMLTDEDCIAVAFNQTSINGDSWDNFSYDEDAEEYISYNVLSQSEHWLLFESIA